MNYQETNTVKLSISGEIMISTKVKKLVQHAYQTVPFYMNIAREKSIDLNEWLELPITHKNDLVLKNDSFISANYLADMLQNKLLHAYIGYDRKVC